MDQIGSLFDFSQDSIFLDEMSMDAMAVMAIYSQISETPIGGTVGFCGSNVSSKP